MLAGQTLKDKNNREVCLFPLTYMYITQGEDGSISHQGTLNIDFQGWGPNGRVYEAPLYAPVSLKCVYREMTGNHTQIFESLNPVVCADNVVRYISIMLMHDNNPIANVGSVFMQGELFAHTGTAGDVGDHTHIGVANGKYAGRTTINGHTVLINASHIYNLCFINNTVLIEPLNYEWKYFKVNNPNIGFKSKFPWVLYARKLRNIDTK